MRKISMCVLFVFLIINGLQAQDKQKFSLAEARDYAFNNSIEIKNAFIEIEDARAMVEETKAIGLPKANFSMDYIRYLKMPVMILPPEFGINPVTGQPNPDFNNKVSFGTKNTFNGKVEVNSLLFDGSYLVGLEAARKYKKDVKFQLDLAKKNVFDKVRDAYLPALLIDETQKILAKNLKTINQLIFETQEMYKEGFVEQLDVDRLELSKANLEAEMENLENQKKLALNYLKLQMNYPVGFKIELSDDLEKLLTIPSKEDLEGEIDYNNYAQYRVLESTIDLNELNVRRYKAGYLPQLVGFGSYGLTYQGDKNTKWNWSDNALVGLKLNVPIFDGFEKKSKIERVNLDIEEFKNNRQQFTQGVQIQVTNARESYRNAEKRLKDREKNLALAQKIYKVSKVKYKEGVGASLEIAQAEQGLYQAQSNYISSKYDLLVAKVNLDKALGK